MPTPSASDAATTASTTLFRSAPKAPPHDPFSTNLVVSAHNHPDKTALRCGQDTLSFAEFDAAAARVATLLERPESEQVTGSR